MITSLGNTFDTDNEEKTVHKINFLRLEQLNWWKTEKDIREKHDRLVKAFPFRDVERSKRCKVDFSILIRDGHPRNSRNQPQRVPCNGDLEVMPQSNVVMNQADKKRGIIMANDDEQDEISDYQSRICPANICHESDLVSRFAS